ncbi:MAG: ABC-2 transporter permease [Clostridiales bacterium]|nr:ABC-2 transporter permease [Clostridiales bacterium]
MKGYLTYFFEQHKRMILSYSVVMLIALIFAVSLKTTAVPASVTILYISIFATLAPVASLNSDREIDQLLSLPGGRRNLVKAQYLNALLCIFAALVAAAVVTLMALAFTAGKAHLPSLQIVSVILSVSVIIIAVMQPLSMIFGRKGLLIGFAVLMFIGFQSVIRSLLTNGGVILFQFAKEYLAGHQIEGVSVVVNEGIALPDFLNTASVLTFAGTAVTLFVSSYVIARLVFARKNFQVNKL